MNKKKLSISQKPKVLCVVVLAIMFVCCVAVTLANKTETQIKKSCFKFDFGLGKVEPGYIQILPTTEFTKEIGYGFEPGAVVSAVDRSGNDALRGDFCTSDKPFYFSVALPEGNYEVIVMLGDLEGESTTTIKAELRRLMVEKVQTAPGKFKTNTFVVNTRTPLIPTGGQVRLKGREKTSEAWAWDDKLTLEFNSTRSCICALEVTRVDDIPTVYILGDSTVCDQALEPWNSWGQMLTRFFKSGVAIANHAESGESLRSSLGARRLDKVMSLMKPGDYLFIQFGHNDMKSRSPNALATYKSDLKRFVTDACERGGIPVLVTSMHRKSLDSDGKIRNTLSDYPETVRQVAKEENVTLIDLHNMSASLYEALGPENIDKAFQDGTHHNSYGSYLLAKYIVDDYKRFDPAHPDLVDSFSIPASPMGTPQKPEGN